MRLVRLLPALLLAAPLPAAALDGFQGAWRGPGVEVTRAAESDGFRLSLTLPGGGPAIDALFEPAGRPGVFAAEDDDPLEGGALVWAREDAGRLVVYRMALDGAGGLLLDRLAVRPDGAGFAFRLDRRAGADERSRAGRLEPAS